MIALAVICLVLAAAVVVGVVATGSSQEVVFNSTVGNITTQPVWVFVAGVVTTLLALIGLSFLGKGTRRRVGQRREMRRLRRAEKERTESERLAAAREAETRVDDRRLTTHESQDGLHDDGDSVGPDSTVRHDPLVTSYDQPDRHLVREPRQTSPLDEPAAAQSPRHRDS